GFDSHLGTQSIHEALPRSIVAPCSEVIVDRALGQQVMRQHVPLATRAIEVKDGVEDLPHVHGAFSAAAFRWRNQWLQNRPLLVREIRRIRLPWAALHVHTPCLGKRTSCNKLGTQGKPGSRIASKLPPASLLQLIMK